MECWAQFVLLLIGKDPLIVSDKFEKNIFCLIVLCFCLSSCFFSVR